MRELIKAIQKADVESYHHWVEQVDDLVDLTITLPASVKKSERVLCSTPLHKAVGEFKFYGVFDKRRPGHLEIACDLLSKGADPSVRGSQLHVDALTSAAFAGNDAAVSLLLERGVKPDANASAALGDVNAMSSLPKRAVNKPDINGMTPLLSCCASRLGIDDQVGERLAKVAEVLIDRGASLDLNWPGCYGSPESHLLPTSLAAMGNPHVLSVLLDHDAPISEPNSPGANGNALAHATWSRCAPCLSLFIERSSGVATNGQTDGWTPYHWIAKTGWPEDPAKLIRFIAKKRFVKVKAVDKDGDTALDIAEEEGREEIAEALRALG